MKWFEFVGIFIGLVSLIFNIFQRSHYSKTKHNFVSMMLSCINSFRNIKDFANQDNNNSPQEIRVSLSSITNIAKTSLNFINNQLNRKIYQRARRLLKQDQK